VPADAAEERQWPADTIERWPIERLLPYAKNARLHTPEQVAQVAAAIREWGWTMPVLVAEEGEIIAGHARVLAAHRLKLREVPTVVARGWSGAQQRAYRIADNKLSENAAWDDELLAAEIAELGDFDIALTGFSREELKRLSSAPVDETMWFVIVECRDEDQQTELITRLLAEGIKVKGVVG
jgi:ParB-like chromosome segregation protein Spo0J